jgi:hypothetical protein
MEQSILKSTKKLLNVDPDDPSFDLDIITHINSAFSHLHQLGIGPTVGFQIEDDLSEWDDFLPSAPLYIVNMVKASIYLRVRLLFDPPTIQNVMAAAQQQLQEADVRLSIMREETDWVDPDPAEPIVEEV